VGQFHGDVDARIQLIQIDKKQEDRMSKGNVIFLVLVAVALLISFNAQSAFPQTADEIKSLRDEIKALKEGQSAIQRDLQEIKSLLRTRQAQPQPQPPSPPEFKEAVLNIDSGHARGDKTAKLVMIEFSDYQ
jgi:hypothetical protein